MKKSLLIALSLILLLAPLSGFQLQKANAQEATGKWYFEGEPVTIRMLIRSDDSYRKNIGDYIADLLEEAGFFVNRVYIDKTQVLNSVYFVDPGDLTYQIYTEGWVATDVTKWVEGDLFWSYVPYLWTLPGYGVRGSELQV